MFISRQAEQELRPDQVRAMAHGLYALADIDGVSDSERELLQTFLTEGGVDVELDSLAKIPFSLDELAYSLDTVFLRRAFVRVSILMARADGVVTESEMAQLRRIAQAMAVDEPLESLMADLEDKTL